MKNSDIKPPFKWTGGKNRMREQYSGIFMPNEKVDTFVDMFCGATSISLWVAANEPKTKIVLNDVNTELMEMYGTIQNDWNNMYSHYKTLVSSWSAYKTPEDKKKFYYELRDKYCLQPEVQTDFENHAMLFFMLKVNFNGMWKAYHKCNGRYSTPPGTCTQKSGFFDSAQDQKFKDFIDHVTLHNGDFANLSNYSGKGTYFYADPPYRDSVVEYQGGFNDKEQIRLADFLKSMGQAGSWFSESNKEIGDGFWLAQFPNTSYNIHDVEAKYTAGRGTSVIDVKEVLITNF
jgi:DNA adenine methylase